MQAIIREYVANSFGEVLRPSSRTRTFLKHMLEKENNSDTVSEQRTAIISSRIDYINKWAATVIILSVHWDEAYRCRTVGDIDDGRRAGACN